MSQIRRPSYSLKSLEKSLRIIELLAEHESSLSITEICRRLGIASSTVHRILATLRYWGYVEQNLGNKEYELGLKVIEIGMAKLQKTELVKEAVAYLKELAARSNETVHLGVLDDAEVIYLAKEEPTHSVRLISYVGARRPVHCTGLGKILLAHLPKEDQKEIIKKKGFHRFTKHTIIGEDELRQELETVKAQGFAQDRGEHEEDVRCIAGPVRNESGKVVAAISISGPAFRLTNEKQNQLIEVVIETAEKISRRLGYIGPLGESKG